VRHVTPYPGAVGSGASALSPATPFVFVPKGEECHRSNRDEHADTNLASYERHESHDKTQKPCEAGLRAEPAVAGRWFRWSTLDPHMFDHRSRGQRA
jgi:hypothetical protein